jgi:hypothetical protein
LLLNIVAPEVPRTPVSSSGMMGGVNQVIGSDILKLGTKRIGWN